MTRGGISGIIAPAFAGLSYVYTFFAYYDEDNYADFAYFTSEAEAREAEQREIPPALAEKFGEWEQLMKVDRYLDITEPWMIAGV